MSLRARVLLGMGLVAIVLIGLAVTITRTTETNLVRQVDEELERSAPQFRSGPDGDGHGKDRPDYDRPSSLYVAKIGPDGSVDTLSVPDTLSTPGDADTPATPDVDLATAAAHVDDGVFTSGAANSDLRYRVVVTGDRSGTYTVYALPLEDVDATVADLIRIEVLATVAVLGSLGLVTFWVLRLGLRPLRSMTTAAAAIGKGDLSARVPDARPGTEAGDLGVALNHMLGRIEAAFDDRGRAQDRLRQFVADASHELRTPVTTIRGYAELYRLGGIRTDQDLSEAMRRTEQEAIRMGDLVQDLLDLARLDQGRPLELAPVDLSALAADAVADARAVDPRRPIDLEADGATTVLGDEHKLRQVLANLVGNARVHTAPDTPIHVRVRRSAAHAVLEVADEGSGMTEEVASRVFERFYRADPARARATGGSGLGLAIVSGAVEAHRGTVRLDTAPGAGTTIQVELPV